MTAVDDAIERVYQPTGSSLALQLQRDRDAMLLAAEVRRLRDEQPFIWGLGFSACQRGEDATRNPYDPRRSRA